MSVSGKYEISPLQIMDMNLSITITMTVSEWRKLHSNIGERPAWPDSDVGRVIGSALRRIETATTQTYREQSGEKSDG